jgi:bifunctional DNase/RNase
MDQQVVSVIIKGVMPTSSGCAVFLGNDAKTFVIYVDTGIGEAIQRVLSGEQTERPLTHDLMLTILDGLGAEVERVIISDVDHGTFYARLILSMHNELGHKIAEIDARPSDAIILAQASGKPIYTANSVFDSVDDMTEILAKILQQED